MWAYKYDEGMRNFVINENEQAHVLTTYPHTLTIVIDEKCRFHGTLTICWDYEVYQSISLYNDKQSLRFRGSLDDYSRLSGTFNHVFLTPGFICWCDETSRSMVKAKLWDLTIQQVIKVDFDYLYLPTILKT
jgi:hypothetical protein